MLSKHSSKTELNKFERKVQRESTKPLMIRYIQTVLRQDQMYPLTFFKLRKHENRTIHTTLRTISC